MSVRNLRRSSRHAIDTQRRLRILPAVSTLVQIESAVAGLPTHDQWSLLTWLQGRLKDAPTSAIETKPSEALNVFRQLQAEMALTTESATAWKKAVADARR